MRNPAYNQPAKITENLTSLVKVTNVLNLHILQMTGNFFLFVSIDLTHHAPKWTDRVETTIVYRYKRKKRGGGGRKPIPLLYVLLLSMKD